MVCDSKGFPKIEPYSTTFGIKEPRSKVLVGNELHMNHLDPCIIRKSLERQRMPTPSYLRGRELVVVLIVLPFNFSTIRWTSANRLGDTADPSRFHSFCIEHP